jgi:lipopolysaccharide export system protein LptA
LTGALFILLIVFLTALPAASAATGDKAAGEVDEAGAAGAAKKTLTVISDKMEADNTARVVVFKGNVEAEEDFFLCSDELRISYGDKDEVSEIVALGNVRIFQEGKTATSEKAVYDHVERTLVLTGSPVVEQCADTVTGDRIVFYIDDDKALVEGSGGGRVRAVIMPDKKCPEGAALVPGGKGNGEETRCKRTR